MVTVITKEVLNLSTGTMETNVFKMGTYIAQSLCMYNDLLDAVERLEVGVKERLLLTTPGIGRRPQLHRVSS